MRGECVILQLSAEGKLELKEEKEGHAQSKLDFLPSHHEKRSFSLVLANTGKLLQNK